MTLPRTVKLAKLGIYIFDSFWEIKMKRDVSGYYGVKFE